MIEGLLIHCPEFVKEDILEIFLGLGNEKVLNNKICIANLLKNVKDSKRGLNFEWETELFEKLIKNIDLDLIKILKEVYCTDTVKYNQLLEKE